LTIGSAIGTTPEMAGATTPKNGRQIHKDDGKFRHWANTCTAKPTPAKHRKSLKIPNQNLSLSAGRLAFNDETLQANQFGMLDHPILCGILHLAYQTKRQVKGGYGLCILSEGHLVMAIPAEQAEKFDATALIHLSALKMESASDGKSNPTRMVCGCH
jgi:hypothetical protein